MAGWTEQQQPQFYLHRAMSLSYAFPCTSSMATCQERSCLFGRTLYPEFSLLQVDVQDSSMSAGSACNRLALKLKKTAGERLLSLCTCFSASDVHWAGEVGSEQVNPCHLLLLMSCFKVRRWPSARVSNHFLLFMSCFGATTGQSVSELISA